MLQNTKGAINKGQFSKTNNIVYTGRGRTKQKHNRECVGYYNEQTNTNDVIKP